MPRGTQQTTTTIETRNERVPITLMNFSDKPITIEAIRYKDAPLDERGSRGQPIDREVKVHLGAHADKGEPGTLQPEFVIEDQDDWDLIVEKCGATLSAWERDGILGTFRGAGSLSALGSAV